MIGVHFFKSNNFSVYCFWISRMCIYKTVALNCKKLWLFCFSKLFSLIDIKKHLFFFCLIRLRILNMRFLVKKLQHKGKKLQFRSFIVVKKLSTQKRQIWIKYKICLLAHKAVQFEILLYLNEMHELREPSTINSQSNYNTWKLVENIVSSPNITIWSFKYCAPHLYNTLPKTIRQIDNIETFRKQLKTFIISETFDSETKTIRDCFAT